MSCSSDGPPEVWSSYHIVAVHPLADLLPLLQKIDMQPADCILADMWWHFQGRLFLVCFSCDDETGVNLYRKGERFTFYVRTRFRPLTTGAVNTGLVWLDGWLRDNPSVLESIGSKAQTIFGEDICF